MKQYDISLINIIFPTDIGSDKFYYVPVGILSLAAYLEHEGLTAEILDYQHTRVPDPQNPDNFLDFFLKANSPVIGISIMAKDMPGVIIACEKLKREKPETIIILGGPGPTGTATHLMEAFPFIDFIVRGEGEETLLELMNVLSRAGFQPAENKASSPVIPDDYEYDFENIDGLVWRKSGSVITNPLRKRIEDLNALPLPAYHLIDHKKYNQVYIPSTRGCRHFCTFCDQPALWQGKEISKSLERLFSEIDYITTGLKAEWEIAFSDNEFCAGEGRFDEFCRRYREGNYSFIFSMDRRIDATDDETLAKAKEIGCKLVLFGLESGSNRVLAEIRKGFKNSDIKPGLRRSSGHIDNTIASFMFNYPFETLTDFLETASLIYSLWFEKTDNTITFQIHYLSPLPRTPIYEKYKDTLVNRNVSNMMTALRNDVQYDQVIDEKNRKAAALPKILDDTETGNIRDERISNLVLKHPQIFPSFYIYNSPQIEIKEFVILCLHAILKLKLQNIMIRRGENFIHFGKERIRVTGRMEDNDTDSVFFRLKADDFDNAGLFIEAIEEIKGKKHLLLSVDMKNIGIYRDGDRGRDGSRNKGGSEDKNTHGNRSRSRETGAKIFSFFTTLRDRGFDFTLLSHIPKTILGFSGFHRMLSQFDMPAEPHLAGDFFYSDSEGFIWDFEGRKGGLILDYEGRKGIWNYFYTGE